MKMLFYRYGSICEPDIISAFQSYGVTVVEDTTNIHKKNLSPSVYTDILNNLLKEHKPAFVFSLNFFPFVAELCHIHNILYLSWSVDCPVMEYFAQPMQYSTNRIFMFDKAQYHYFRPYNPDGIFYLPLASAVERFDTVTSAITDVDLTRYQSDISFVGSLYYERSSYHHLQNLPPYIKGYLDGIIEASLQIYGYNFMEESISDELVAETLQALPNRNSFYTYPRLIANPDKYALAHRYMGEQAAVIERTKTMNTLAKHFTVDLYTGSDISSLEGVRTHGTVNSLTVMPKVFHLSKINLNMTSKSIQTGLPLRIFDIMGCGGFLMTNYQSEIPDYFEIGTDLETYDSMEELIDKCAFYLEHDDIRRTIAQNGYQKVKAHHTYPHRIAAMLRNTLSNI